MKNLSDDELVYYSSIYKKYVQRLKFIDRVHDFFTLGMFVNIFIATINLFHHSLNFIYSIWIIFFITTLGLLITKYLSDKYLKELMKVYKELKMHIQ